MESSIQMRVPKLNSEIKNKRQRVRLFLQSFDFQLSLSRTATILFFTGLSFLNLFGQADVARASTVVQDITQEATALNSNTNHPLPLLSSWSASTQWDNSSTTPTGYAPVWQMSMIDSGSHLLPWFNGPSPGETTGDPDYSYYLTGILEAKARNLPLVFNGTQWEHLLYDESTYFNLPNAQNPNVISSSSGNPVKVVSAFGPVSPWQSVGTEWATSPMMQLIEALYPNPPMVIFISNNEASVEQWSSGSGGTWVEQDQHYLDLYGTGQSDEFRREKVAQGWIDRYRALQQSWKNNLVPGWQSNVKFIAYGSDYQPDLGRWGGWINYSLYNTNRIDPGPLMWDGGSASSYLDQNSPANDDLGWSPQMELMNGVFQLNEAYTLNPSWWYEQSVWNGCDWYPLSSAPGTDSDCNWLKGRYPTYTPNRYGGMVQFDMWLTQPRDVRDFRGWAEPRSQSIAYFNSVLSAVERVWNNATLKSFWRNSILVANTSRSHPYTASIPSEYSSANRMFMLTTDEDPNPFLTTGVSGNAALSQSFPIDVMARVTGTAPNRQWLLYAFAPTGTTTARVTIPSYKSITLDGTTAGAFYSVNETAGTVVALGNGDGGLVDTQAPAVPLSLTLTATSPTSLNMNWATSTDDFGYVQYKVFRCTGTGCNPTTEITNTDIVSYTDTNLSAGTVYRYVVQAYDTTSNSSLSSVVAITMPISLPGLATNPSPSDAVTNIATTTATILSWSAGALATSHGVYFGTTTVLAASQYIGNQSGTTYNPGTLQSDTTYYWRIDEVNSTGTTTGAVWSFTTVPTLLFEADLKYNLNLQAGTGSATFSRNSAATVMGYGPAANSGDAQTLLTVASNEARFQGARRVSQGVWSNTFANGAPISDVTLNGYLAEGQATNIILQSEAFDTAAWSPTNMTVTPDTVTAPDGNATADTLTATTNNATTSQSITGTAVHYAFSVYLKRGSGAGTVSVSADGTNFTACTINSSTWTRCSDIETLTVASYNQTIKLATSGDVVYAWGAQTELGLGNNAYAPTSYIPSTVGTRLADFLYYPSAGNYSASAGSAYVEINSPNNGNYYLISTATNVANGSLLWRSAYQLTLTDDTASRHLSGFSGVADPGTHKLAASYGGSSSVGSRDGVVTGSAGFSGTMPSPSGKIQIGIDNGNNKTNEPFGAIRNVKIFGAQLANANLQKLTDATAPSVPSQPVLVPSYPSTVNLSWAASTDNVAVAGYKIYRDSVQVGTSTVNSFSDTGLLSGISYTYTVAAFDGTGNISVTSSSASTSITPTPSTAGILSPANAAVAVTLPAPLSWTAGTDATSHGIYFGTSNSFGPLQYRGNQSGTTYNPGTLQSDTTYYWRIDEVNNTGTTTGTVQSFTTGDCLAPSVPASLSASVVVNLGMISIPAGGTGLPNPLPGAVVVSTPVTTPPVKPSGLSATQIQSILDVLASFNADSAVILNVRNALSGTVITHPATAPQSFSFTRNLSLYQTGMDVKALQQFLNTHGFIVASSGPGSLGNEISLFGIKTYSALVAFQKSQGLPQTGWFGPMTRAKASSL